MNKKKQRQREPSKVKNKVNCREKMTSHTKQNTSIFYYSQLQVELVTKQTLTPVKQDAASIGQ